MLTNINCALIALKLCPSCTRCYPKGVFASVRPQLWCTHYTSMPYRVPVASLAIARDTEVRSLKFALLGIIALLLLLL